MVGLSLLLATVSFNTKTIPCLDLTLTTTQHKAAYTAGTKKQKVMISKSIVETIYSMEPPGRFMKKCTDTGLWRVLSQREAADKTAQAMAYVVRTSRNATKKHSSIPLVSTTSQLTPRPNPPSYANTGLEDSASSPTAHPHVPGERASDLGRRWDTNNDLSSAADLMGRHHEFFPAGTPAMNQAMYCNEFIFKIS